MLDLDSQKFEDEYGIRIFPWKFRDRFFPISITLFFYTSQKLKSTDI